MKKPEAEAAKPAEKKPAEPEPKKAEAEDAKMATMNGPQVVREKLPDGGEKVTTTRQVQQADGTVKTVTESKTVYPEVTTGQTQQKVGFTRCSDALEREFPNVDVNVPPWC